MLFSKYSRLSLSINEQDKESEYRPQGVYIDVHDQGGTELDTVLRSLEEETGIAECYAI